MIHKWSRIPFISVLVLFLIIPLAGKDYRFNLKVNSPSIQKEGNGYSITFTGTYRGTDLSLFSDEKVQVPAERYRIEGPLPERKIQESNLLFAGIRFDCNGDGDFKDSFTLKPEGNLVKINGSTFPLIDTGRSQGLMEFRAFPGRDELQWMKLSKGGPVLLVESYDLYREKAILQLFERGSSMAVLESSNPALMVSCISETDNYDEEPPVRFEGQDTRYTFTNIAHLEGQAGSWAVRSWCLLPLTLGSNDRFTVKVTLTGAEPPFIVEGTSIISIQEGVALVSRPGSKEVK
jgi:hypothetical protein